MLCVASLCYVGFWVFSHVMIAFASVLSDSLSIGIEMFSSAACIVLLNVGISVYMIETCSFPSMYSFDRSSDRKNGGGSTL